jgi:hypothetical protein
MTGRIITSNGDVKEAILGWLNPQTSCLESGVLFAEMRSCRLDSEPKTLFRNTDKSPESGVAFC